MLEIPSPVPNSRAYATTTGLLAIVDNDKRHLSISHRDRYPTWDEIHQARDQYLLPNETYAMFFPPAHEYVNISKNCFHLYLAP